MAPETSEKPKSSRGGRRDGAGAKKKQITILRQLAIEAADKHAAESLQMLVDMRDECTAKADRELKRGLCNDIMDRVWGKSKIRTEIGGPNGGPIQASNPLVDAAMKKLTPDQIAKLALAHAERNG